MIAAKNIMMATWHSAAQCTKWVKSNVRYDKEYLTGHTSNFRLVVWLPLHKSYDWLCSVLILCMTNVNRMRSSGRGHSKRSCQSFDQRGIRLINELISWSSKRQTSWNARLIDWSILIDWLSTVTDWSVIYQNSWWTWLFIWDERFDYRVFHRLNNRFPNW